MFASLLAVSGCAVQQAPPPSVQAMPNDCANRTAIINWLTHQAAIPQHPLESVQAYEQVRAQLRHRIWHLRYNCQPV